MSKKSRPPNPGWFPKGRSGNPPGRRKGSRPSKGSAFEVLTEKTLFVTNLGTTREMTIEEALQKKIYQDALSGKLMAIREVLRWVAKREAWHAKNQRKTTGPAVTQYNSPDPANADAALLLLGIAAANPKRAGAEYRKHRVQLLLEPWGVQAALRRRRGGHRLTDRERAEIRRCTRDPDCLRWPRGTDE